MNPRERAKHALRHLPFTQEAQEPYVELVEIEIVKAEREAAERQKGVEEIVEDTILLLKALSEGQGYAMIEVFDVGAAGGFESGRLCIEHLRDGKGIDQKARYSPRLLKELILDVLLLGDQGLPGRILIDADWNEYVAESEA